MRSHPRSQQTVLWPGVPAALCSLRAGLAKTNQRFGVFIKALAMAPTSTTELFSAPAIFSFPQRGDSKDKQTNEYMLALPQKQTVRFPNTTPSWGLEFGGLQGKPGGLSISHPVLPFDQLASPLGQVRGASGRVSILGVEGRDSKIPPFILQAPKLRAKIPQTLKQLKNNLKLNVHWSPAWRRAGLA